MIVNFDFMNQLEKPYIILCNPNKEELLSLDAVCYNTKLNWKFNALSELEFDYPESINSGSPSEPIVTEITLGAYDALTLEELDGKILGNIDAVVQPTSAFSYLKSKRLVKVENFGYFTILEAEDEFDGATPIKKVKCVSLEGELLYKKLTAFGGQWQFYSAVTPEDSLMGQIILLLPGWSIGSIDGELSTKQRSFDVSDTTIYSFLMNDVEQTFGCVFTFDTVNKTISAELIDNVVDDTSIFLSFDNVLKEGKFKEISDEISTALYVYGGNDLDIRSVNPLGTNVIYNFDYYVENGWMGDDLSAAVTNWQILLDSYQSAYSELLTLLREKNTEMGVLETELTTLEGNYVADETTLKGLIEQNASSEDIAAANAILLSDQSLVDGKNEDITAKQSEIDSVLAQIVVINETVSFDQNFTPSQLIELHSFIFENTYLNENIIQTDIMTAAQIQDQAQELYDQAQMVLGRVSQPRYEFNTEAINFTALLEYQEFTDQLELGDSVTIQLSDNYTITAVLLEVSMDLDDPSDFSLTFSNRLRLDNGSFIYSDLMGQIVKTGKSVSFDKLKWNDWTSDYKNDVTTFITSALNAANNQLINSDNQEITIGKNGLKGRQAILDVNGTVTGYEDTQVWLTSSILAFTNDAWNSAGLAIGKIKMNEDDPDGSEQFGVVADYLVGHLVAANNLIISNDANTFTVDENGATLLNASFTIEQNDTRIVLDPSVGIKIESKPEGTWNPTFFVDGTGNLNFAGNLAGATGTFSGSISATSGTFGGWELTEFGFKKGEELYINSNGNLKFGGLEITGSTAKFSGDIWANSFHGNVITNENIVSINAEKINAGSINGFQIYGTYIEGGRIYGTVLEWADVTMQATATGVADIYAGSTIEMRTRGGAITINSSGLFLGGYIYLNPAYNFVFSSVGKSGYNGTISGVQFINGLAVS